MSKVKDFSMTLDEIIEAGDKMIASYKETISAAEIILNAVRDLKALFSAAPDTPAIPEKAPAKAASKKKAAPEPKPEPEAAPEVKSYSKEEVRAILAEKSSAGMRAEVKALLTKYGASQLGQLDPQHYVAVVAEAEALHG